MENPLQYEGDKNHEHRAAKLDYIGGEITKLHTNTFSPCGDFSVHAYKIWLKGQPYLLYIGGKGYSLHHS
jgi:lipopolysaccharide assembly outer membrane protein LptD (OstA)